MSLLNETLRGDCTRGQLGEMEGMYANGIVYGENYTIYPTTHGLGTMEYKNTVCTLNKNVKQQRHSRPCELPVGDCWTFRRRYSGGVVALRSIGGVESLVASHCYSLIMRR